MSKHSAEQIEAIEGVSGGEADVIRRLTQQSVEQTYPDGFGPMDHVSQEVLDTIKPSPKLANAAGGIDYDPAVYGDDYEI